MVTTQGKGTRSFLRGRIEAGRLEHAREGERCRRDVQESHGRHRGWSRGVAEGVAGLGDVSFIDIV